MEIIYKTLNAECTPEVLGQLFEKKAVFESASQHEMKGRFSMVVFDYYGTLTLKDDLVIETNDSSVIKDQPFEALNEYINQYYSPVEDEYLKALPFVSGFLGHCSFDMVRHQYAQLKALELEHSHYDDVKLYMVESVYVFDHYKEKLFVITSNLFSKISTEELHHRLNEMVASLQNIQLFQPSTPFPKKDKVIETNISEDEFLNNVKYFKSLIHKGDMFQAVPSRIYKYVHGFDHLNKLTYQLYKNLKRQNPSPYMYYMNFEGPIVIGSSPESFVKVHNDTVVTNPIAGTIKRGQTKVEDEAHARALIEDEKELSEHRMLVDLGRNDLHRISHTNSVTIDKKMQIERYEHVMHIVSVVTGKVRRDIPPLSIVMSLLPTGTVSGAPKLRAIERIYETRPQKRGIYSGGVGYINCNFNLDFALAIRTMLIDDTYVNVEAGCGVVYDSNPQKELIETQLKAKSLLEVSP